MAKKSKFIVNDNAIEQIVMFNDGQYIIKEVSEEIKELIKKGWIKEQYIIDERKIREK